MLVERLNSHNFESAIAGALSVVVFGTKNCVPCQELKENLSSFPQLRVLEFHVGQISDSDIVNKYRVKFLPRGIFFKDGKEVGRFLGWKTIETLTSFMDEIQSTGRLNCDPQDLEERSNFINRVKDCLGWVFNRDFPYDQWPAKIAEWEDLAEKTIAANPGWLWMTDDMIKSFLAEIRPKQE